MAENIFASYRQWQEENFQEEMEEFDRAKEEIQREIINLKNMYNNFKEKMKEYKVKVTITKKLYRECLYEYLSSVERGTFIDDWGNFLSEAEDYIKENYQ